LSETVKEEFSPDPKIKVDIQKHEEKPQIKTYHPITFHNSRFIP
jgi:hypothetical protein